MKKTLLFILFLFISFVKAQTLDSTFDATLIEINFTGQGYGPKNLTKTKTKIFFSAETKSKGRELWTFNPVTNIATIVKDIYPGEYSGIENSVFFAIDEILYFSANDGINGQELWRSDGTSNGTYIVKDINASGSSSIANLIAYKNNIIFSANDNINGQELWISDGTNAGTKILKDVRNGINGSDLLDFFVFNDFIFFSANDGINGRELWKSDGTTEGTTLLKDIFPGGDNSIYPPGKFIVFKNNFYFFANNGVNGNELWRSDGTTNGTQLFKELFPGYNSNTNKINGSTTDSYFVFAASTPGIGIELWKSDGTPEGTFLLKDINPIPLYSSLFGSEFVTLNNKVFFTANDGISGQELWTTDGTENGTQIVKDIWPGPLGSYIYKLTSTSNSLIFSASENNNDSSSLWKSDGTTLGTKVLKNVETRSTTAYELDFVELNNNIYFQAGYNGINGVELWKTDGTTDNTKQIKGVNQDASSNPKNFTNFNGKLLFAASNTINQQEAYITDGTIEGTKMLKDIDVNNSINFDDYKFIFSVAGKNAFFRTTDGLTGFELYKTDGTENGTQLVKDIAPGIDSGLGQYQLFTEFNNIFYFKADDKVHGEELWRSDGTDAGTYMLKDINPGLGNGIYGSNIPYFNPNLNTDEKYFAVLSNNLYFTGFDGNEYSIWKTDGTPGGTTKIISPQSTGGLSYPPIIINSINGKIFFKTTTANPNYGSGYDSLWSTDGTENGTKLLGKWMSQNNQFVQGVVYNNEFYCTLQTDQGQAILKSDGTVSGTIIFKNDLPSGNYFKSLKSCGNYLYFTTSNDLYSTEKEIWRTDGIANNTVLLEKTAPVAFEYITNCTCVQNNLFYLKNVMSSKKINYFNDGTTTPNYFEVNVSNSENFKQNEGIVSLANYGNNLMLTGYTKDSGTELYSLKMDGSLGLNNPNKDNSRLEKSHIKLFPNPASLNERIYVTTDNNAEIKNIEIYNVLGSKIQSGGFDVSENTTLDLKILSKGIYFVKIKTQNYTETKKLIIN